MSKVQLNTADKKENGPTFDDALDALTLAIEELSEVKRKEILRQAHTLITQLQDQAVDKDAAVKAFLTHCKSQLAPKHASIAKAVMIFAVAAVVTVLAGVIGFGIGFVAGAWTGPGAFFAAIAAGAAAALSVVAIGSSLGLLGGVAAHRYLKDPSDSAVLDVETFARTATALSCLMISKKWNEILQYGRWAPSPHNMQSWLFQVEDEDTITLMYDPKRLLPGTNPTGSFMHVSFGILHEMLSIAAAPLGLEVDASYLDVTLDPKKEGPQPLATLKLVKRQAPELLDRELIHERQTSRLPYDGRRIPEEVHKQLAEIAEQFGNKYEYSDDKSEVDWVVRLNAETMFYDMSNKEARDEVSSWMRFSKKDAVKRADGLAAYTMGVSGPLMWLFANANWAFRLPGIYQLVRRQYEKGMTGTSTVSWISGPFETPADCERAGRMMARMWLTMTKNGVYLHPFGSVITNPEAHAQMDEHFQNPDREHDLWMLMRMGYSETPPKAQRMPLAQMIVPGGRSFQPAPSQPVSDTPDVDSQSLTV